MSSAIVLGAGMAGVGVALHLRQAGWDVVLVDRQPPGRATSYGNAGIIQSEAVEPYAMPRGLDDMWGVVTGRTNGIRIDWSALPAHVPALLRYWWHSAPVRHRQIARTWSGIIGQAAAAHQHFLNDTNAAGLVRKEGFRVFFRSAAAMDAAFTDAERIHRTYGVPYAALDSKALAAAEPGLANTGAGAVHWQGAWTVRDPGALVEAYGDLLLRSGGSVAIGSAETLKALPGKGWRVETANGPVEAAHVVVALGPWSPELLRRFGYDFPMVRKRGHHRHYDGTGLDLPLMDEAFGYVLAPMAKGLRITTGAELSHADAPPSEVQIGRAEDAARTLLNLGKGVEPEPWLGVRPCMPDMLPVIGEAPRHKRLWLHFGHGHQGFTLGPATGQMLATMMRGEAPSVDPAPFRPERWTGG
ncbi:NAD(P)/FAD-dependent oxidoreductase [Azorhizobium oxalatiphilum]|uniref:NAD(P)/FAD-dependent oxidoreductase n=1 Tax=Azorhizobium oxalatiphilum TaxID=980631 RepID=UPI001667BD06|nr:FAD-binding oxidoreductase [Azorhizobium oxalatiphilum]